MLFVDLHLFTAEKTSSSEKLFDKYASNINYVYHLDKEISPVFIQHAGFKQQFKKQNVEFVVVKANQIFPFLSYIILFAKIRKMRPDVILLHGFIHPFKILLLRLFIGSGVKLMLQNHAELPFTGWRRWPQRLAALFVSRFLFVSNEQAKPWIETKIIKQYDQVVEVMEGSTAFQIQDKEKAKKELGFENNLLFLWVGRLDKNKDPLTILRAFSKFAKINSGARLLMIYGSNELEAEVKNFITINKLSDQVILLGNKAHNLLETYYNAADYFVLGSHYEGSGYALCEAMSCGCVPIVTRIPSFSKMLRSGYCGYLFDPGMEEQLVDCFTKLREEERKLYSERSLRVFKEDLSFEAIAKRIERACHSLFLK